MDGLNISIDSMNIILKVVLVQFYAGSWFLIGYQKFKIDQYEDWMYSIVKVSNIVSKQSE